MAVAKDVFSIQGLEKFKEELLKLPIDIRAKIERKSSREGAKVMADAIARLAPKDTGNLKESIKAGAIPKRYLGGGDFGYGVLARRRGDLTGGYYLHLLDQDHKIIVKKGARKFYMGQKRVTVGVRPGDQFVKEAFEYNQDAVVMLIEKDVASEIAKANRKAARGKP
jgi:hypothetical protein